MFFRNTILFFFITVIASCNSGPLTLFKKIASSHSGIHFNNKVEENDSINPIDLEFLYNGGGVAVGDFNNDNLPDLYFTASTTSNKLYLNKGNFIFDDVTQQAGVTGEGRWCNAASVADINNDGLKDIYVCTTIKRNPAERTNLLYINQGVDKNNVPVFKEMAAVYGLADTSYSVHAGFFDYDNDGDLDMFLATTMLAGRTASQFFQSGTGNTRNTIDIDKLFRNDWSDSLKHPVFTDVSQQAGITHHGFALGLSIADINKDGWKDIYVTNDFYSNDELYINNHDGTFTNKRDDYFKHTTQNAMGNDVADINNDGLADIIAVDMNPEDNYRKKKNMGHTSYFVHQNMLNGNYALQYVRNTLQLNQGPRMNANDSTGDPIFSDIGFFAGVAETDWSWAPSVADFDNDGYRDIIITNGYPRDVTDHDFGAFRSNVSPAVSKKELIEQIPVIKIPNYAFRNTGQLQFENVTAAWGMEQPSFSYGAVYVDLDNDGDLDYVVNNINDEAFVFENTLRDKETGKANFLQVKFTGDEKNPNGLGAIAELYIAGQLLVYENFPWRGYLSTVSDVAHFGLGSTTVIDSVIITWPNSKKQVLKNVAANQLLPVNITNAMADSTKSKAPKNLFTDVTRSLGIQYRHIEMDFIDFDVQRLLPHKLSQYGPGLAAGDVDGNGLDDLVIGGNSIKEPVLLLQQPNGKFIEKQLPLPQGKDVLKAETMGILVFDADTDGDMDIYCVSGSNEYTVNTKSYHDRLYINQGLGNFIAEESFLPANFTSKSCVKAADFDNDGDLDLFIGGRTIPGKYPHPVSSFIYRNNSKPGSIQFTDVTKEVAKDLEHIGLVCDAVWTDFDNDGAVDLLVAGEWMPLTFLRNNNGLFQDITSTCGIAGETGWWNSIAAGDFDNDGDMDYVAGNLGQNSFYRTSPGYPLHIYAKDFDNNQGYDALTTIFLKDEKGALKEFTAQTRDEIVEQLPILKKRAFTYKEFGKAGIHDLLTAEERKDALVLQATNFKSSFIKNLGNGKFELHPLPGLAQLAPVFGIVADDINRDGLPDIVLAGNDYGAEVTNGRYDAFNGLLLLGDGKGNFNPQTIAQSGIYIPGDAKALVKLQQPGNNYLLAASCNRGDLKVFKPVAGERIIPITVNETYAIIHYKNGSTRKEEFYYGTSFLSQSSRFIVFNNTIESIELFTGKGSKRLVK